MRRRQMQAQGVDTAPGAIEQTPTGAGDMSGMGLAGMGLESDQLSDEDLAAMGGAPQAPMGAMPGGGLDGGGGMGMDPSMGGMEQGPMDETGMLMAALQDPNTPPQQKQQIQAELALAARRRLGGLGGGM